MARIDRPDSTGGGAGTGGGRTASRSGGGITGKAGKNVKPFFKNVKEPSSNVKTVGKPPEEDIPPHYVMWADGGNKYGLGN